MVVQTATISGPILPPGAIFPHQVEVTIEATSDNGTLRTSDGATVYTGSDSWQTTGDGDLTAGPLPLLPQTDILPPEARWRATFRFLNVPTGTVTKLEPIVFALTGNTTWGALVDVSGVSPTETLLAAIVAARDETLAARDAAVAVGDSNDTIIAGRVDDSASATRAALALLYARLPDLTPQIDRKPFVIGHRAIALFYGEETLEGVAECGRLGIPCELDLWSLSDGTLVPIRDPSIDRTLIYADGTTATGLVSALTLSQWRTLRIKPRYPGSPNSLTTTWAEVLDLWGGRVLLVPELFEDTDVNEFVDSIVSRGLQRAVLVQSQFTYKLAPCQAAGMEVILVKPTLTAAEILAAGITRVCATVSETQPYVDTLTAAGIDVVWATPNTRAAADAYLADPGVTGVFTDDPIWINRQNLHQRNDPYWSQRPWAGFKVSGNGAGNDQVGFEGPEWFGRPAPASFGGEFYASQDWSPEILNGKARITFTIKWTALGAQAQWCSLAIGEIPAEQTYVNATTTGQNVYHCLIRRDGRLQVYKNTAAGGTVLLEAGSTATPTIAASTAGYTRVQVEVNDTSVIVRNLDLAITTTATDATIRPARARWSFGMSGLAASFGRVLVEQL